MKLRYVLISLFSALTLIPLLTFWLWPHSSVLETEIEDVYQRHLLLARNQSAALQRYHRDVSDTFDLIATNFVAGQTIENAETLLSNLNFLHICLVRADDGVRVAESVPTDRHCPDVVSASLMKMMSERVRSDVALFSEVSADANGDPIIYVFRRYGKWIAFGCLETDYFVTLGKSIAFGLKGHAAIVDHKGNVLSHPLDDWIATRKNIAKVSAVQKMLRGETGVDTFYSPALKSDMIAGFTAVKGTGWGVMIPQPLSELEQKAEDANQSALAVLLVGLGAALCLAIVIAEAISRPMNKLIRAYQQISGGTLGKQINVNHRWYVPTEFMKLQYSFNDMLAQLTRYVTKIKAMAFIDHVTGALNRNAFSRQVLKMLELLTAERRGGALLFLDLDGFKAVNDTHGHEMGDMLLRGVVERMRTVLTLRRETDFFFMDSNEVPNQERRGALQPALARFGGDEFVIFLPHVQDKDEIANVAEDLADQLTTPFEFQQQSVRVGASIGCARFPQDGATLQKLLQHADDAMYMAKRAGKNTYRFYDQQLNEDEP